jgi:hypothetical protein
MWLPVLSPAAKLAASRLPSAEHLIAVRNTKRAKEIESVDLAREPEGFLLVRIPQMLPQSEREVVHAQRPNHERDPKQRMHHLPLALSFRYSLAQRRISASASGSGR